MNQRKPLTPDPSPDMKGVPAPEPEQAAEDALDAALPACARRPRGPSLDKTAQTRLQILHAALAEFAEQGIARSTMERIARRAQVAKGTIYVYYPSKEELLRGVIEHALSQSPAYQPLQRLPGETIQQLLRRSMQAVEHSERGAMALLVLSEAHHDPVLGRLYKELAFDPWQRFIEKLLHQAVQEGELQTRSVPHCAQLLVGPFWTTMVHNSLLRSADAAPLAMEPLLHLLLEQMFASGARG